jgi:2-phosphoglycerate kinase
MGIYDLFVLSSSLTLSPIRICMLPRIVGQTVAKEMMKEALNVFFTTRERFEGKPLVILLAGPPGHGKTVFSQKIAELLRLKKVDKGDDLAEDAYRKVDIGAQESREKVFGMAAGYEGATKGTNLW